MKEGIHPNYREVIFKDLSTDFAFLTRSTVKTRETLTWTDGKEYQVYKVEVSSASHPFYTGKGTSLSSTAKQVDKFRKRFGG